ncbi:MAG TPA: NAD-dependent epimerase/dehydratase family protein [Chitinophagaceae bacterium]|nr:NAD-dependent epimerase/dehydratase family protein [Chitinophagaceae bacterium]
MKEKILIIGACGQIGVELTAALRSKYGNENVIAGDVKDEHPLLVGTGPFVKCDVMNKASLLSIVKGNHITQVYLLAAILSATGEKNPTMAWEINMQSLMNILNIAKEEKLHKVYWPSSIAVFGPNSPKKNTPQHTIIEPTTVYGISKYAGEQWCAYYHRNYGVDVRSIRYPGLISYKSAPGGGTTDYAIDIYIQALKNKNFECFLSENTYLPMMYMPDAIRATIELMEAPAENIKTRTAYNINAMSFSPKEIAESIKKYIPDFQISYRPDFRQQIADSWPHSIDDNEAQNDWFWKAQYDLDTMTTDMLKNLLS